MFDRERQPELMGLYGANFGRCKSCDAVWVSDSLTLIPKIIHGYMHPSVPTKTRTGPDRYWWGPKRDSCLKVISWNHISIAGRKQEIANRCMNHSCIDRSEVVKPESHPENLRILQLLCLGFLLRNFLNLGIQCRQSLVKQARIGNQMWGRRSFFFNHKWQPSLLIGYHHESWWCWLRHGVGCYKCKRFTWGVAPHLSFFASFLLSLFSFSSFRSFSFSSFFFCRSASFSRAFSFAALLSFFLDFLSFLDFLDLLLFLPFLDFHCCLTHLSLSSRCQSQKTKIDASWPSCALTCWLPAVTIQATCLPHHARQPRQIRGIGTCHPEMAGQGDGALCHQPHFSAPLSRRKLTRRRRTFWESPSLSSTFGRHVFCGWFFGSFAEPNLFGSSSPLRSTTARREQPSFDFFLCLARPHTWCFISPTYVMFYFMVTFEPLKRNWLVKHYAGFHQWRNIFLTCSETYHWVSACDKLGRIAFLCCSCQFNHFFWWVDTSSTRCERCMYTKITRL